MKITLDHIIPFPIAEQDYNSSQIWGQDLLFEQGQKVQIQAPSGKGKSTLLHIIYGNRRDYHGAAALDGKLVSSLKHKEWAQLRQENLSMVFQDLRLFPDFTGRENLQVKLSLTDYYDFAVIEEMTDKLGVKNLLSKKCGQMSFGERQRFAILRALIQPFDWLLLDEPFSHLDLNNARIASQLILEECEKRGAGFLIAGLDGDQLFEYDKKVLL